MLLRLSWREGSRNRLSLAGLSSATSSGHRYTSMGPLVLRRCSCTFSCGGRGRDVRLAQGITHPCPRPAGQGASRARQRESPWEHEPQPSCAVPVRSSTAAGSRVQTNSSGLVGAAHELSAPIREVLLSEGALAPCFLPHVKSLGKVCLLEKSLFGKQAPSILEAQPSRHGHAVMTEAHAPS